jgi:hypothetical protein
MGEKSAEVEEDIVIYHTLESRYRVLIAETTIHSVYFMARLNNFENR